MTRWQWRMERINRVIDGQVFRRRMAAALWFAVAALAVRHALGS